MSRTHPLRIASFLVLAAGLLVSSGCLFAPLTEGATVAALEPGVYYVEQDGQKLVALDLPEDRDGEVSWVEVGADEAWFQTPGMYRLSDDFTWSLEPNSSSVSPDELIQLHDAAPAAPAEGEI